MQVKTIMNRLVIAPLDIPASSKIHLLDKTKHSQEDFARLRVGRVIERGEGYYDWNMEGKYNLAPKIIQIGQAVIFQAKFLIPFPERLRQQWNIPYVYIIQEQDVICYLKPENDEEKKLLEGDYAFEIPNHFHSLTEILNENAKKK
jgi:hypothetical protein